MCPGMGETKPRKKYTYMEVGRKTACGAIRTCGTCGTCRTNPRGVCFKCTPGVVLSRGTQNPVPLGKVKFEFEVWVKCGCEGCDRCVRNGSELCRIGGIPGDGGVCFSFLNGAGCDYLGAMCGLKCLFDYFGVVKFILVEVDFVRILVIISSS